MVRQSWITSHDLFHHGPKKPIVCTFLGLVVLEIEIQHESVTSTAFDRDFFEKPLNNGRH